MDVVKLYESLFFGKTITVVRGTRRHKKFIRLTIIDFQEDGWLGEDDDGNLETITWDDIFYHSNV